MSLYKNGIGTEILEDLLSGVTPTYSGWDTDPTDGIDITDGDMSTICTTGTSVLAVGWDYVYIDFDLPYACSFLATGFGHAVVTAGDANIYLSVWHDGGWEMCADRVGRYSRNSWYPVFAYGSKLRVGLTSDAGCNISPNIYSVSAWKL